jgi:hypothetical protein
MRGELKKQEGEDQWSFWRDSIVGHHHLKHHLLAS